MPPFPLDLDDCERYHKMYTAILESTRDGVPDINYEELADVLGFRNRGQVTPWLEGCENRLKGFVGRTEVRPDGREERVPVQLFKRRNREKIRAITEEGKTVEEAVKKILTACHAATTSLSSPQSKSELTVAAPDSLVDYLFPAVLEKYSDWWKGGVRLRFLRFLPGEIVNQLLKREVEVAITWHGFAVKYDEDYFDLAEWDESNVPVHAIMHPKHPLARRLDAAAGKLEIPAEELVQYPIVYPILPQLVELAKELQPDNSHHIGGLPAVFNTVCWNDEVVGLFPGGPWPDLAQLRCKDCIRHAALAPRPNEDKNTRKNTGCSFM